MKIISSSFSDGDLIPREFTCDGSNINPPLEILDVPVDAKSLVIMMDDIAAPGGVFTHWLVFDVFPGTMKIPKGSVPEGVPGKNSAGREGYTGPCPQRDVHRYCFRIYALDILLKLPWGTDRFAIDEAMRGHVLDFAELTGVYTKNN